jgi:hypothetical protein
MGEIHGGGGVTYYTVEHYRAQFGQDLTLEHDSENAAREYLRQLSKLWRGEGCLVSCAATEIEPARIVGQSFNERREMYVTRKAWLLADDGRRITAVSP